MITGTEFSYYYLCKRKLWLFSHGICMELGYGRVLEGRLLHETSYPRKDKELGIAGIVIDNFDHKNKIIHEVKLTPKMEHVHIKQLQYYIYLLKREAGMECTGKIDYPKLKRSCDVVLSRQDEDDVEAALEYIDALKRSQHFPDKAPEKSENICKTCAYAEYCFA